MKSTEMLPEEIEEPGKNLLQNSSSLNCVSAEEYAVAGSAAEGYNG